jgi:hypothetical protein
VQSLNTEKWQNETLQKRADDISDHKLAAVEILATQIYSYCMCVQIVLQLVPEISVARRKEAPIMVETARITEIRLGEHPICRKIN